MPRSYRGLIAVAFLSAASSAAAQTDILFNRPGSGARAAGMANAFIGISDDGTAASWNPAGLAQLRSPEISIVTNTSRRSGSASGFRSRDDSALYTKTHSAFLDSFLDFASLAVPLSIAGRPVTLQASWRRLYALDYRQNTETTRDPRAENEPSAVIRTNSDLVGSINLLSVAGAVKVTPRLAVGASVNGWRGEWEDEESIYEVVGSDVPRFGNRLERNHLRGDNVSVGVMLTYPRWSLGLLHLTPLRSGFDAEGVLTASSGPSSRERVEGTLRFARAFGGGVAWRPAPQWTVAADMTWDEWTGATLQLGEREPTSIFDGLPASRSATRNTLSMNAGAERLFHGEGFVFPLRFGAAFEPQGGRSPYTLDAVSWIMLAAGTGYNTNSLKFDAAVQYRWTGFMDGGHFSVDEPMPPDRPSAVGERSLREWRVKLSVILRVTDTEKLRRAIDKIFGDGAP